MRQYKGVVFFVDILGIGSLTRGRISLLNEDYESHGIKSIRNTNTHFFSAKLLMKFRKVLNEFTNNKDVNVSQLSDCAFIWSEKPTLVIDAAIKCMWKLVREGIFCRGGIAYGKIVEPDRVNNRLGGFILGEAATKAVDLEKSGKGCRIFSDTGLPSKMKIHISLLSPVFVSNKNPNDCLLTNELRWYLFPKGIIDEQPNKRASLVHLMRLVALLRYSPMFRWNESNEEGEIHLASSIETLSSGSSIFTKRIDFKFLSENLIGKLRENRSNKKRISALKEWRSKISSVFR